MPGCWPTPCVGSPAADSAALKDPNNSAAKAWREAGLQPLGFHEARHTFASIGIGAGLNAKTLSIYMGHANIGITFDTYGHLFPGNEAEARLLLDIFPRICERSQPAVGKAVGKSRTPTDPL